jgi:hypothetical protein
VSPHVLKKKKEKSFLRDPTEKRRKRGVCHVRVVASAFAV